MNIYRAKRALLDKLRIIEQTDDDHWLIEPINTALDTMECLKIAQQNETDLFMKNNELHNELEIYKRAIELACNEIRERGCLYYEYGSSFCKENCEMYLTCTTNKFEEYFLQEAREE